MSDYNREYWKKKLKSYRTSEWITDISPFAQTLIDHIEENSHILELGGGTGHDSHFFLDAGHSLTMTDALDSEFESIRRDLVPGARADLQVVDLQNLPLPFEDDSFDAVYAHSVLHYFNNREMHEIIDEIKRVLRPGGVIAVLVNPKSDPEYSKEDENANNLIEVNGILKRYFSLKELEVFLGDFDPIIANEQGMTPKDVAKGLYGMVQFIGVMK